MQEGCFSISQPAGFLSVFDMEATLNKIIQNLEGQLWDNVCNGVAELDTFIALIVPQVSMTRSTQTKHPSLAHFVALQDSFQYNLASRLLGVYRMANSQPVSLDEMLELLQMTNRLLQGLLLIHPESRRLFSTPSNMNCVLQYVSRTDLPTPLIVLFVSTLIHILLKSSQNMRQFENLQGCTAIIQHLHLLSLTAAPQDHLQQEEVNFKTIEFLLFYFIDESPLALPRRTTAEKIELFRPGFPEIDVLVRNLDDLRAV